MGCDPGRLQSFQGAEPAAADLRQQVAYPHHRGQKQCRCADAPALPGAFREGGQMQRPDRGDGLPFFLFQAVEFTADCRKGNGDSQAGAENQHKDVDPMEGLKEDRHGHSAGNEGFG